MPTATNLIIDTSVMTFAPPPTAILRAPPTSSSTPLIESSLSSSSSVSTATAEASADSTPLVLDPAQRVYDELPTRRYTPFPRPQKEAVYGDKPQYSPRDDEPPHSVEADRRTVPVGDSYFPEGETWQKFDGRTANHPESFIYTGNGLPEGMGPGSPDSPGSNGPSPRSGVPLARPRPSLPILVVLNFANEGARPSFESTTVNRASIFGEASARARGSVVIYESHPIRPPTIVDDPFAAPADLPSPAKERFASKKSLDAPGKRSYDAAKRSVDGGKKSFEAYSMQVRSRDARAAALDTLAEDADETSAQGHGTISSARAK
ncbi:hypothetical protein RHS01_04772 [Rhizoctonia solani]|uniref:Uncharacterized protein n=1 Tax=Rhizoctonia solani TaxID=456999 RepID=A0A8H7M7C9_9AGAM|nr:hypothetical protein RHS01_04772 [Rhizoctonia solani]